MMKKILEHLKAHPYRVILVIFMIVLIARGVATWYGAGGHDYEKKRRADGGIEGGQDYDRWHMAAQRVIKGQTLTQEVKGDIDYDAYKETKFFRLPPAFAVYVSPLGFLPYQAYLIVWYLISAASGVLAVLLAVRMVNGKWLPDNPLAMALPAFAIAGFAWADMHCGNTNLIQLAMMMLAGFLMVKGANAAAGAGIGLAITLKAFPVALLPPLFAARRIKPIIWSLIAAAFFTLVIPGFVRGFERNWNETSMWYGRIIRPYSEGKGTSEWKNRDVGFANHSVSAMVNRLTQPLDATDDKKIYGRFDPIVRGISWVLQTDYHKTRTGKQPISVNIVSLPPKVSKMIVMGIAIAAFAAIFLVCRKRDKSTNGGDYVLDVALAMNFILLVSPISWYYFLSLLLLPTAIGARAMLDKDCPFSKRTLVAIWIIYFTVMIASTADFWIAAYGGQTLMCMMWFVIMLILRKRHALKLSAANEVKTMEPATPESQK